LNGTEIVFSSELAILREILTKEQGKNNISLAESTVEHTFLQGFCIAYSV
jgi:hypothetical protein